MFPWGDAGGELSGATGNTQLGTDLGADGKLGDAGRITPPGPDLGAGGELGVATGNTPPRTNLGADGAFGVSARNTLPGPGLGAEGYQLLPPNRNRKDVRLNRVCPYGRTRIRAAARAGNPIQRQR
ncbi:hypothetical protein IPC1031_07015 [Pseudomonas aeruginosa]|nr:hypothetical protein IPC1031_07015 [Pseudomonas aeruginosa]RQJ55468.1 hypothetical protein IPC1_02305 [Pseudomonas aeruginosa]RUA45554.1 hypothetical protein IPC1624_15030 [Pseudomonas aeruginosa]RUA53325.1 hypothetical protein IPC1621_14395 [Pseudomonas aeruginosa]HBP5598938.1 hypothetical protein [Pseudomonas aeruginosa]